MTTIQRNALTPAEGMLVYNTDVQKFQGFVGDSGIINIARSEVSTATYFIGDDGINADYLAQTFTPQFNGLITSFEFQVSSLSPGFQLTIELYEGDTPGIGSFIHDHTISVNNLGWNMITYPANIVLLENTIYHFILKPSVISSNFLGLLKSDVDTPGMYEGGTFFSYQSATGMYQAVVGDDLDFRVTAHVNTRRWVDLH
jgi:hypothetical protein